MGKIRTNNQAMTSEPKSSRNGSSGSALFQCQGFGDCRMVFTRSEHLARHIRKHTGERPFQCHCLKNFSRLDNLRQHCQTVHEDKPELNEKLLQKLASIHSSMSSANRSLNVNGKPDAAQYAKKRKADSDPVARNDFESEQLVSLADRPDMSQPSCGNGNLMAQMRLPSNLEAKSSISFPTRVNYMKPVLGRPPLPAASQSGDFTPMSGRVSPPYLLANYIRTNNIPEASRFPGSYPPAPLSFTRPMTSRNSHGQPFLQPLSSMVPDTPLQYSPFVKTPMQPLFRCAPNNDMRREKYSEIQPISNDLEKVALLPNKLDRYSEERPPISSRTVSESSPISLKRWSLTSGDQGQKATSMLTPVFSSDSKASSFETRYPSAPHMAPVLDTDRSRLYAPYLLHRRDSCGPKRKPERYSNMSKYLSMRHRHPAHSTDSRRLLGSTSCDTLSSSPPISSSPRFTPLSTVKAQNSQNSFAIP